MIQNMYKNVRNIGPSFKNRVSDLICIVIRNKFFKPTSNELLISFSFVSKNVVRLRSSLTTYLALE